MNTLICLLVDESGSMAGREDEVIDAYNEFVNEQKKIKEEASLSLIKFNSCVTTVYSNVPIQTVSTLNRSSYRPGERTALLDAIVAGIELVDGYKKSEDRVIFVIITDGEDTVSKRCTELQVKQTIADRSTNGDWSFVYIGELAKEFAATMGISASNAIPFCHEKGKMKANFVAASEACTVLRSNN